MIPLVTVDHVSKEYRLGKVLVTALHSVSLTVEAGEFLAISGPSGSGKTTLLHMIGCIEPPSSGTILIENENVRDLSAKQLAHLRATKLGFIFQNFNLIPVLSALENVEFPLHLK